MKRKHGSVYECPEGLARLQSMSRHDFVRCKCANGAFVDGGGDYCRMGVMRGMPRPIRDELGPHER